MNRLIFVVILVAMNTLTGCEKKNDLCGGSDPARELAWLKEEIAQLGMLNTCKTVSRSTYKNQTVFIFSRCEASALNGIPFLYSCEGTKINLTPADYQELKFTGDIELIWKSK